MRLGSTIFYTRSEEEELLRAADEAVRHTKGRNKKDRISSETRELIVAKIKAKKDSLAKFYI